MQFLLFFYVFFLPVLFRSPFTSRTSKEERATFLLSADSRIIQYLLCGSTILWDWNEVFPSSGSRVTWHQKSAKFQYNSMMVFSILLEVLSKRTSHKCQWKDYEAPKFVGRIGGIVVPARWIISFCSHLTAQERIWTRNTLDLVTVVWCEASSERQINKSRDKLKGQPCHLKGLKNKERVSVLYLCCFEFWSAEITVLFTCMPLLVLSDWCV